MLSLKISKLIVQSSGGEISVDPHSIFYTISLPQHQNLTQLRIEQSEHYSQSNRLGYWDVLDRMSIADKSSRGMAQHY